MGHALKIPLLEQTLVPSNSMLTVMDIWWDLMKY